MEEVKLNQEQIDEATAYFNLASLLGRSIQSAAFLITHPDYEPERIVWLDKPAAPPETEEDTDDEEAEPEYDTGTVPTTDADPVIRSGEGSVDDQIEQIISMYTPGLIEFLRRSALPVMFHIACEQFSFDDAQLAADVLTPADQKKAALAWVIVKRVFAVRHPDEAAIIISATEAPIRESKSLSFRPVDEIDRQFIVETCSLCQRVLKKDLPLADILSGMEKELRREQRTERVGRLSPLSPAPNGEVLNWLYRVVSNGSRLPSSKNNRHESIVEMHKGNSVRLTHSNAQNGSTYTIEIAQADKLFSKTNKTFVKMFFFTLQKMTAQNFPLEVGFSLQELIDLKMYSKPSNAWRAVQDFIKQSSNIFLTGLIKKGKKSIENKGNAGLLFYNAELNSGYVTISVNEKFNMEFIASQFTEFPLFAYALKNINAFLLVRYIFYIARQNTARIKESGTFTIKLNSVRENLGLPAPEDVKNRRYRQLIIEPIEDAIEEIENALQTEPEAKEYGFTITPYVSDSSSIHQWLDGYLEIGLKGDFAEKFIDLATKAEAKRERWNRIKTAELAKLAAKKEMTASESAP